MMIRMGITKLISVGILLLMAACMGGEERISSAGIREGDRIELVAADGSKPAVLLFEKSSISTTGAFEEQTLGVTFTGIVYLQQDVSPAAFSAIQGGEQIELEILFIDTERKETPFLLPSILMNPQTQQYTSYEQPILRQTLPFALENIARIVLKVDRLEVAIYPKN